MGRLIDADLLKKNIAKWLQGGDPQETEMVKLDDIAVSIVMEIEEQPTAYDVEKVVAELVEMRNKDSQGCKDVGNKCLSYTDCGLCIMDRAIDIVKRGGVDD